MVNSLDHNRMRIKMAICAAGLTVCRLSFSAYRTIFQQIRFAIECFFPMCIINEVDSLGLLRLT